MRKRLRAEAPSEDDDELLLPQQIRRLNAPIAAQRSDDYSKLIGEIALRAFERSDVAAVLRGSWAIRLHLAAVGVDVLTPSARKSRAAAHTDIDFYLLTDDAASAKARRPVHKDALSEPCDCEGINTSTTTLVAPARSGGASTPGRKVADFTVRTFSKSTSRRRHAASPPRAMGNAVAYGGAAHDDDDDDEAVHGEGSAEATAARQLEKLDAMSVLVELDDSPFVLRGPQPRCGGWRALRIEGLLREYAENRRVAEPFPVSSRDASPIEERRLIPSPRSSPSPSASPSRSRSRSRDRGSASAAARPGATLARLCERLGALQSAAADDDGASSLLGGASSNADASLVAQAASGGGGGGHSRLRFQHVAEHSDDSLDGGSSDARPVAYVAEWVGYAAQLLAQAAAPRSAVPTPSPDALRRIEVLVRGEELDGVAATAAAALPLSSSAVAAIPDVDEFTLKQREDDWKVCVLHLLAERATATAAAARGHSPTAGTIAAAEDDDDLSRKLF